MGDYIQYLKSVSIFSELDQDELHRIAEICAERDFLRGDVVFVEHTEGDELFVILEGEVTIQLELISEEDAMPLITLQKGDVFGELSVVDDAPRSATARCLTDCRFLVLKREDFNRVLESDPAMGYKVMSQVARLVSRRVRATNQKIVDSVSWGML